MTLKPKIAVLITGLLICKVFAHQQDTTWHVQFTPDHLEVSMGTSFQVLLSLKNVDTNAEHHRFQLRSENSRLASVQQVIHVQDVDPVTATWRGNVTINAIFLGSAKIYVDLIDGHNNLIESNTNVLELTIVRQRRIIDHVFTVSVALLVSLLYINFGAALDLRMLRAIITRPVGPVIGFLTQYLLMPLLSYGLACLIFPQSPEMQLGLFFTGVSPSGGASNIWAVVLGGNINLSVLMTTISNFAAFGMMPLWLFTLGQFIFERGNLKVPYTNIATFAVSLVVPLAIGIIIQKWSPRLTRILVRLLKPVSIFLIVFIVIFAIITNLYIFQLFSWQIVLAGSALPWMGYILAWCVALALRQNSVDALTIAIETGIQNTGVSIFLLRFSLPQPQADLTTVIPVAVAIMTPFPLLALYIYMRCGVRRVNEGVKDEQSIVEPHSSQE